MKKKIHKEIFCPFPTEQVWEALTDPQALSQWFMDADFQPEVGYRFTFREKPRQNWDGILQGEVLTADRPTRLVYTWKGNQMKHTTLVKWELSARRNGTLLRLDHSGFDGFRDTVIGFFHQFGWGKFLRQLSLFLKDQK